MVTRQPIMAELAEREAAKYRAALAHYDAAVAAGGELPDSALSPLVAPKVRAEIAAYDGRPPCGLTPAVLGILRPLLPEIADLDCGWLMHSKCYRIEARIVYGNGKVRADRLVSGLALSLAQNPAAIWASELMTTLRTLHRGAYEAGWYCETIVDEIQAVALNAIRTQLDHTGGAQ